MPCVEKNVWEPPPALIHIIHISLLRYGLYDFEYEHQCQGTTDSSKKQKLFLMSWCPDSAKIKKKMLYASSFETLKKSLVNIWIGLKGIIN